MTVVVRTPISLNSFKFCSEFFQLILESGSHRTYNDGVLLLGDSREGGRVRELGGLQVGVVLAGQVTGRPREDGVLG